MQNQDIRVLIVAEHASAKFGGEAALPLHYFRMLRQRGIDAWLVVHERTRSELESIFAADRDRLYFVPDTFWHRFLHKIGERLPHRLSYITVGAAMRTITQVIQRRMIQELVQAKQVTVIHQPMPVSPKEPSMIFGMKVPVVIGPMNGGMDYPPAFNHLQSRFVGATVSVGRLFSNLLNKLIPGKLQATVLLVANSRTGNALPTGIRGTVIELVENGVDLALWQSALPPLVETATPVDLPPRSPADPIPTRFVYIGRLVDWKAVDLLLLAFQQVAAQVPATLEIIGDGSERANLEALAKSLQLLSSDLPEAPSTQTVTPGQAGTVTFAGWLSQADCAQRLQSADAMVLPSLLECGGAVVLEAMAMARPVIATNWGGPTDYLDETCGILVDPTSREAFIEGLAAAMLQFSHSPQMREAMGRAGRQRVLDYFSWDTKVNRILEIYQDAIAQSLDQHKPTWKTVDRVVNSVVN